MKKKIFSAALLFTIGLATAGTFVSCSDYDDDINNLQEQIDKLASADELSSKIAEMQSAISSAKTDLAGDISAVQTVADAAKSSADAAKKAAEDLQKNGATASQVQAAQKAADAAQTTADSVKTVVDDYKKSNNEAVAGAVKAAKAAQATADSLSTVLAGLTGDEGAIAKANAAIAEAKQAAADAMTAANKADSIAKAATTAIDAVKGDKYTEDVTLSSLNAQLAAINGVLKIGDAGAEIDLTALNKKVNEIDEKLTAIIGDYSAMVTSVSLYYDATQSSNQLGSQELKFTQVTEQANVFGSKTDGPITFTQDSIKTYEASLIIRVNPTTADLTKSTAFIHLINSQGKELDDYVTCTNAEPYTELLTTRAAGANNGLWKVTFKLKNGYDAKGFKAEVTKKINDEDQQVLFAVAVKNTIQSTDERRVISAYAVKVSASDKITYDNDILVSNMEGKLVSINDIRNRWGSCEDGTSTMAVADYVWATSTKDYPTPTTAIDADGKNVLAKDKQDKNDSTAKLGGGDNRTSKDLLSAEVNKAINIKVAWDNENNKAAQEIAGFYVTLDSDHALESAPSELNAWESYGYENVGTSSQKAHMFKGNEGQIMIKSSSSINDIIGFRVYAVALDGKLLDPDGRAFYVVLGNPAGSYNITEKAAEINAGDANTSNSFKASTAKLAVEDGMIPSGDLYQKDDKGTLSKVEGGIAKLDWTPNSTNAKCPQNKTAGATGIAESEARECPAMEVAYLDKDGKATSDVSKVTQVTLTMKDVRNYVDGETYSQTCKIYDKNGVLVKTITASATKVMPTDVKKLTFYDFVPTTATSFEPLMYNADKTNDDGNKRFAIPDKKTIADLTSADKSLKAKFDLIDVFQDLKADGNYSFTFANSDYDANKKVNIAKTVEATGSYNYGLTVANSYVDKTTRDMTVGYIYRGISTKLVADNDGNKTWSWGVYYTANSSTVYSVKYRCWDYSMAYAMHKMSATTGKVYNVSGATDKAGQFKANELYYGSATWTSTGAGKGEVDLQYIDITNTANDCLNLKGTLASMVNTKGDDKCYLLIDESSIKTNTNQYKGTYNDTKKVIELEQTNKTQINETITVNLTFDVYDLFGHKTTISVPVKYTAVADE